MFHNSFSLKAKLTKTMPVSKEKKNSGYDAVDHSVNIFGMF